MNSRWKKYFIDNAVFILFALVMVFAAIFGVEIFKKKWPGVFESSPFLRTIVGYIWLVIVVIVYSKLTKKSYLDVAQQAKKRKAIEDSEGTEKERDS